MNPNLKITTPPSASVHVTTKSGTAKGVLEFNSNFGSKYTNNFTKAQRFVDSEVLRLCAPLAPRKEGILIGSGTLLTVIGSGVVRYGTPYGRRLHYNPQYKFREAPQRGGLWFARMKAKSKDHILRSAGRIAGGG